MTQKEKNLRLRGFVDTMKSTADKEEAKRICSELRRAGNMAQFIAEIQNGRITSSQWFHVFSRPKSLPVFRVHVITNGWGDWWEISGENEVAIRETVSDVFGKSAMIDEIQTN